MKPFGRKREPTIPERERDLCTIAPVPVAGRRASACLGLLRARRPLLLDGSFGEDLLRVLAEESLEERHGG